MSSIHPDLKRVLEGIEPERTVFLAELDSAKQAQLAKIIEDRLEAEGSGMYSTLAFVSNIIPKFLKVKIAQEMLGAKTTAKMTAYVPVKQAIEMARALSPSFLADVALYLKPEHAVEVMEGTPDSVLLSVAKKLMAQGQFETIASLADHMSAPKLKTLTEKLNDPMGIVQTSRYMRNTERLIETALQLNDTFLAGLIDGIVHFEYYDLAAMVGEKMDVDRQIFLLEQMDHSVAARLASHYDPETTSRILDKIDDEQAVNIAMLMKPETLASLFNFLSVEQINRLVPYLAERQIAESLPLLNKLKLEKHWNEFTEAVQKLLNPS